MSNYNIQVSWSGKDALSDSDPAKIISGADFNTEFSAIQTAVNTKADLNGNSGEDFAANDLTVNGTLAIGGTDITATAAELNILDGVTATASELNILDGITSFLDEDNMSSDSDTSLASQQSIKAYVDSAVGGISSGITSYSNGTTGNIVFSNGLKVQWGSSSGTDSITFGSAYSSAVYNIQATAKDYDRVVGVYSISTTGFTGRVTNTAGGSTGDAWFWIAIGV